jgi:hypothetical protein
MSKLCAPVRDEEIAELRQIKDVVPLFQGIMKTMEHMKLDMANFMVQQVLAKQERFLPGFMTWGTKLVLVYTRKKTR